MYRPGHFWSLLDYREKFWRAGIEDGSMATPMPQAVYMTGELEREIHGQPVSYFYAILDC